MTGEPPASEVERLRAEVAALRERLDVRQRRVAIGRAFNRFAAALLVMIAAFGTTAAVVGIWAARTTLNTDRWVDTVASLPKDPQIAAAVADYATTEVFSLLDVESRLREALPERAAFAATPIAGQLQTYVRQTVEKVLVSDRFQALWVEANRRAHQQIVAIVEGRSEVVAIGEQRVSIDLLPLINEVLRDLEGNLPELFGRRLNLPDLSGGEVPDNLRSRVQAAVGVTLPANFAQFTIYDAGRLYALQRAVVQFKRGLIALIGVTVAALGLALWISPDRRRTLLQYGIWLAIAVIAMTAALRAVRTDLLARLPAGEYRDAAGTAVTAIFGDLRERGQQVLWLGLLLALACYLAGPGRLPVWLRRMLRKAGSATADLARRTADRDALAGLRSWVSRHRDPLRLAGVAVAGVASLVLSSWTGLLVMVVVLLVYEVLVTLLARAHSYRGRPSG